MQRWMAWHAGYTFVLIACGALIVLADWLFYRATVGWTAALFAGALAIVMTARNASYLKTRWGWILLLALAGLLVSLIVQPTLLVIAYTILLLGAIALVNSS